MLRDFIAPSRMVAAVFVAGAVCLAPLSACGVKGPLKPPPKADASAPAPGSQPAPSTEPSAAPPPKAQETRP